MQILIIAGTVGKDAVLRNTQSDTVLGFSLAVSNGKDANGNDRPATWYDCAIWGKRAASLERHITKGTRLTLQGRPTVRVHDGKAYQGITVDELTFGSKPAGDARDNDSRPAQRNDTGYGAGGRGLEDDIPFAPEVR